MLSSFCQYYVTHDNFKGRFVVFSKQILTGYLMLGQVILGQRIAHLGQAIGLSGLETPRRGQIQEKTYCENTKKPPLRGVATKGTIPLLCNAIMSTFNFDRMDIMKREKLSSIQVANMDIFCWSVGGEGQGRGNCYFSQLEVLLYQST